MTRVVAIHGHCVDPQAVAESARSSRWSDITGSPEPLVVAVDEDRASTLAASSAGLVEHVHARLPDAVEHDPTVAGVVSRSGLSWEWDHAAVAELLMFGHPLGDRTLHRDVARLRGGTVVRLDRSGPSVEQSPHGAAVEPGPRSASGEPAVALERLLDSVGRDRGAALSMSGGLDSRLLLAAMLADGQRPELRVSGRRGCADRDIADQIARRCGLDLHPTEVSEADVVAAVDALATASNGIVPAPALAGRLHLGIGAPSGGGPVALGINGELARGYYASRVGWRAALQSRMGPSAFPWWFCRASRGPFSQVDLDDVAPGLRAALEPAAVRERLREVTAEWIGATALDLADDFYRFEHLQRFDAADLAAVSLRSRWTAPLADPGWMDAVAALPRAWRSADRFHRWAIGELAPALLEIPRMGDRMALGQSAPRSDWLRGPSPERGPHYIPQAMFRSGPLLDMLIERSAAIDDLVSPALVSRVVAAQRSSGLRPHLVFSLLAMASHRLAVDRAVADRRRDTTHSRGER